MQTGGLDPTVRFGPRQSTHVLHDRLRRQEALPVERVRPIHHTRCRNPSGLDGATQHLDLLEPAAQLDSLQDRQIDIEQPRQRHRRPTDRSASLFSRGLIDDRGDKPQPHRGQDIIAELLPDNGDD